MPTEHKQVKVTLTEDELTKLQLDAKEGESDSSLIRRKLKLQPLTPGARKGNKNAARGKAK